MNKLTPYQVGAAAFRSGLHSSYNPHPFGSQASYEWCSGFNEARENAQEEASHPELTDQQQREQAERCSCRGTDDLCPCQNVPDAKTRASRAALTSAPTPAPEGVDLEDVAIRAFVAQRASKEVEWVKDWHVSDFRSHDPSFTPLSAAVSAVLHARLAQPASSSGTDVKALRVAAQAVVDKALKWQMLNSSPYVVQETEFEALRTALGTYGGEG